MEFNNLTMAKEQKNRKLKPVKLVTEQSKETIDFVQFIEEVLSYDLVKKGSS